MSLITNALMGHVKDVAIETLTERSGNLNGRSVRPLGHWSSTLLWVATAFCVAGCVVAALATAMPLFIGMTSILMPVFSITLAIVGASCAVGAYYISKFVPEYAFEDNVREFQEVVAEYEERVIGLQNQSIELQLKVEELDKINQEFDVTSGTLKDENEKLKQVIGQFDVGSVDLAKQNLELKSQIDQFNKLFDEHERQINEYRNSNKALKLETDSLSKDLALARSSLEEFMKKINELSETKESLSKHIAILQNELTLQRDLKKSSDRDFEELRGQISEMVKQLRIAETTIKDLSETKTSLEERSKYLEATNETLTINIEKLNKTLETLQISFDKIDKALKGMSRTSDGLGIASNQLSGFIDTEKSFVSEGEKQAASVMLKVDEFLTKIDEQKQMVAALLTVQDDLLRLKSAKESVDAEVERLALQVGDLQKENLALKLLIDKFEKARNSQFTENDRTEEILEGMKAANEAFSKLLDKPFKPK
jgi:chromosome segregation ATPase